MNSRSPSSKRASLSVPGTSGTNDDETPTIGQLLAETNNTKPLIIPSAYLTVDSNVTSGANQIQHRGRS
jgi:hypothetical protein